MERIKNTETLMLNNKIKNVFSTDNILSGTLKNSSSQFIEAYNYPELKKLMSDEEMIGTVKLFFECDLNITNTSQQGFMHRNTLLYRLDKVKEATGLNVKNFNDAVLLYNVILVHDNLKENRLISSHRNIDLHKSL